jgi:hypothetical protein
MSKFDDSSAKALTLADDRVDMQEEKPFKRANRISESTDAAAS